MGRPRKASQVLQLTGQYRKNPQRRLEGEPDPDTVLTDEAPTHLSRQERRTYRELVRRAHTDVLSGSDGVWLEVTAKLLTAYRESGDEFPASKLGLLMAAMAKLGMNPADRSRVAAIKKEKGNTFDKLLVA